MTRVNVDYKPTRLQIGDCGAFRLDVKFTATRRDGKAVKGYIVQRVTVKTVVYDCSEKKNPIAVTKNSIIEMWRVPGAMKDSWISDNSMHSLNDDKKCKGKTTVTAIYRFMSDLGGFEDKFTDVEFSYPPGGIDPNNPFMTNEKDPVHLADQVLDTKEKKNFIKKWYTIDGGFSKDREFELEWDCCEGKSATAKIDKKETKAF